MPRLSIGIPVFNGEDFLPELLDSLLTQTFEDFEILISDNASTDQTQQIGRDYARQDCRVSYSRNERNLGAVANYNRVFELSKTPLFKWAAHDDIYRHDYLEKCVRLLNENPDTVLAHAGTAFIDEASELLPFDEHIGAFIDRKTGRRYWPDTPTIGDSLAPVERFWQVLARARWGTHMFGVVRREILEQTSLLPNFAGSDRAMLTELALLGRFRCTSDRLFLKRIHSHVSATLNDKELRRFLSTDGKRYSRRLRQVQAFLSAPRRKPIGVVNKTGCFLLVAAHSAKVTLQHLSRGDPRRARHGYGWPGALVPRLRRRIRG